MCQTPRSRDTSATDAAQWHVEEGQPLMRAMERLALPTDCCLQEQEIDLHMFHLMYLSEQPQRGHHHTEP